MFRIWFLACILAAVTSAQENVPAGGQQLNAFVQQALENNPAVRESFANYRAALQRIPQATALPDPMLEIMPVLRAGNMGMGRQRFSLSLSQSFPWFGKLDERGKIAAKEADYQARLYDAARADVTRKVRLAYYDLAFTDQAINITGEEVELLSHFERLAQVRYAQGEGLQQEVIKLQTEITQRQNRLEELSINRVDAETMLNELMNRQAETSLPRATLGPLPRVPIKLDELYELASRQSPEMKAAFDRIEREEKRIHAAKKDYWPDFRFGVGYLNVGGSGSTAAGMIAAPGGGKDMWSFTVGVEIPIQRRRRDAAVLEATESMIAAKQGYQGQQNMVETAIPSFTFRLRTVKNQIELFEKTFVPQAEQALRASEAAYSTGSAGVLELLDSERMLLDIRLGLAQLRADYMKSLAELERAVGTALPEVNS